MRKAFLLGLWSLPVLVAFVIMCTHWVAVPYWDEWDTPGAQLASFYRGTLSFAELWSQHNEHRLLFPRLVWLPLALVGGWDVRPAMLLSFIFVCLGAIGLYRLLRFTGASSPTRAFVFGLFLLFLFSPRQYATFLVGAQGVTFVPTFALIFALLMNLSRQSLARKTLVNAALAFIATYSFGNGMLLWLLAFPLAAPAARARIFWRIVFVLLALVSIAAYFISYQHPPLSPPVVASFEHVPAIALFVAVWIGSLFSVSAPGAWGAAFLLLFFALVIAAIQQMRRTKTWRPWYPWLTLGGYTLISSGIAAVARLGFPQSMAGDSRYTAFSAFFYIALCGLACTVYAQRKLRSPRPRFALPLAALSLLFILVLWGITFQHERRWLREDRALREHTRLVVQWINAIPLNPELVLTTPYPRDETLATIRTLDAHHALRPALVSDLLAKTRERTPPRNRRLCRNAAARDL